MKSETRIDVETNYSLLNEKETECNESIVKSKTTCLGKINNDIINYQFGDSNPNTNFLNKHFKLLTNLAKPSYLRAGLYAQLVSILICCTGIINSELGDKYKVNIPTAQSVINYVLLACIFTPIWYIKDKNEFKKSIKTRWWKYFLVAFADVEANYLIIKAYSLTIMTTIQVIDAFILPITLILSYFFLKLRYKRNNVLGVIGCLCGCGLIVTADYLVHLESGDASGKHRISGDILCFMASILYAVSNVASEFYIKENSKLEYLSMIGFFGTLISIVQMFTAERTELTQLIQFNNLAIWVLFLLESLAMFLIYSIIPLVLEISSAAFLNVNMLTSDFYSVLVGIFLRQYKLHYLYFVGLSFILFGTILYSLSKPKPRVTNAINNSKIKLSNQENTLSIEINQKF